MSTSNFWSYLAGGEPLRCQLCLESSNVIVNECKSQVCEDCIKQCAKFGSPCPMTSELCWVRNPDGTPVMRATSSGEKNVFGPCKRFFKITPRMTTGCYARVLQGYHNRATGPQLRWLFNAVRPVLTAENRKDFPFYLDQCSADQLLKLVLVARAADVLPEIGTDIPTVPADAIEEYLAECRKYVAGKGPVPYNVSRKFRRDVAYEVPEEFRVPVDESSSALTEPHNRDVVPVSIEQVVAALSSISAMTNTSSEFNNLLVGTEEGGVSTPRSQGARIDPIKNIF